MRLRRTRPARPRRAGAPRQRRTLLRSAGFRVALVYTVVFALSALIFTGLIWYSVTNLLERQAELAIHNDAAALNDHYAFGGLPSLVDALRDRLSRDRDSEAIYLLLDPLGNRVIGNLDSWPVGLSQTDGYYELTVARQGRVSAALLRSFDLSGGGELLVGRDLRASSELLAVLRAGLFYALVVMVLLGLAGAFILRTLFRRMMRDISATTRAIAGGDLSRRMARSGNGDEFDELAAIVNDMLDRIGRLMDGVRQVSNAIAHDLRTPITRARARLEDALLSAGPDDLRHAVERATMDLDGIVAVFEALLRIAEIEAGSRRAAFAAVDLSPLMHDINELYHAVAEENGVALTAEIGAELPIYGDRELIQQAIANLLDNALKFSPKGKTIALKAEANGSLILLTVADQGPGIAAADIPRAAERFFRAESARSTSGSGLGLTLVAAVAQLHGGTLRLLDNTPGLRAVISLPARVVMEQ